MSDRPQQQKATNGPPTQWHRDMAKKLHYRSQVHEVKQTKTWRLKEATEPQLRLLHELGYRVPPRNRGQAADIITLHLEQLRNGLRADRDEVLAQLRIEKDGIG